MCLCMFLVKTSRIKHVICTHRISSSRATILLASACLLGWPPNCYRKQSSTNFSSCKGKRWTIWLSRSPLRMLQQGFFLVPGPSTIFSFSMTLTAQARIPLAYNLRWSFSDKFSLKVIYIDMGYGPSVTRSRWLDIGPVLFFFCFVEVHKHTKKERGQYPAILTEQAWSIKDVLYGIKH